ncbi:MAG: hypothetical protein JJU11_06265 [Candidatus Sumerlaeia bacterium]|nr:hypothetical protein [Candidatus Sumerlaeia bacterium]
MKRRLCLREYDRVRIGNDWAPDQIPPSIPSTLASKLDRIQRVMRLDVLDIGRHEMRAKNFVGTIAVGGYSFDILPKIDEPRDLEDRTRLVEMLSLAGFLPNFKSGVADLGTSDVSLLDYFMALYVGHLRSQWRRGRIMGYHHVEANRTALKGKLLIPQNLHKNLLHPERFYTRTDNFTADVPVSRFLKAALRVVTDAAQRDNLRRDAEMLLSEFDEVADVIPQQFKSQQPTLSRQHARFDPVLQLARMILSTQTPDRSGQYRTYALLFDMNRIFEGYMTSLLRRYVCPPLGLRAEAQIGGRYLLKHDSGRHCFALRPDLGIFRGKELLLLIDTKWKRLNTTQTCDGVSQADMYQVYAYGKEFGVDKVVLLYPNPCKTNLQYQSYLHQADSSMYIRIGTVSVARSARETVADLINQVAEIVTPSPISTTPEVLAS